MRERFEQRLFRIFAQAGYSPVQLLTITPEEMVEIPGITVPNIRAVLCVQNKVLADRNKVRSGKLVEALLFSIQTTDSYPVNYDELIDLGGEEKSAAARPELSTQVENMADYDVIFLGYPNWWYDMS